MKEFTRYLENVHKLQSLKFTFSDTLFRLSLSLWKIAQWSHLLPWQKYNNNIIKSPQISQTSELELWLKAFSYFRKSIILNIWRGSEYTCESFFNYSFFIRTSKFSLRLTVLNFFSFLRLKYSQFVLISPNEPCNATKKNVRLSTIKAHYFISFILFLSSSAHRQPLGGVPQKSGFATVLKPIKKYLQRGSIFH